MRKIFSHQEVLSSATRSAGTGVSNTVNASFAKFASLVVYITGKSGSPWLDISMQCSPVNPALDNTKWSVVYQEPRLTDAIIGTNFPVHFRGHQQEDFNGWIRIAYQVGGASTPQLTFSAELEIEE